MAVVAGREPQRIDLKLYAGDSQVFLFTLTDGDTLVDVTVGQWTAQIRPVGLTVVEAFLVTPLGAGVLEVSIDADTSQRLGLYKEKLRWDLQQNFDDGNVTTHAGGYLIMTPDVTPITGGVSGGGGPTPGSGAVALAGGGHLLLAGGGTLLLDG